MHDTKISIILQMVTSNAGNPERTSAVELSACAYSRGNNSIGENIVTLELPTTGCQYLNINEMYESAMSRS